MADFAPNPGSRSGHGKNNRQNPATGAGATTLHALTDVNVTEGSGIDTQLLSWNQATSKWVATAPEVTITQQTGSYQFVLTDANTWVRANKASPLTFTIPANATVAFVIGTTIIMDQMGAGALTVAAGAGVTLENAAASATTTTQYSMVSITKVDTDTWVLGGTEGLALSGLSDVNVTEATAINGYSLVWNQATLKWIAAGAWENLADGAGIDCGRIQDAASMIDDWGTLTDGTPVAVIDLGGLDDPNGLVACVRPSAELANGASLDCGMISEKVTAWDDWGAIKLYEPMTFADLGNFGVSTTPFTALSGAGVFMRGRLGGLIMSNDPTTPSTVIDIAAGCSCDDQQTFLMASSAFTKTTGLWASGSGHGGLDVGTVASNLWYHVFQIIRPDTLQVDFLLSLSCDLVMPGVTGLGLPCVFTTPTVHGLQAGQKVVLSNLGLSANGTGVSVATTYYVSALGLTTFELSLTQGGAAINLSVGSLTCTITSSPNLPANYTNYRRIGSFRTDGSLNILAFTQWYDEFIFAVPILDLNTAVLGTTAVLTQVSVPRGVVVKAHMRGFASNSTVGANVTFSSPAETSAAGSTDSTFKVQVSAQAVIGHVDVQTDIAGEVRTIATLASTTVMIYTYGWTDPRGQ